MNIGAQMTSNDPEPPVGTIVAAAGGDWTRMDDVEGDARNWVADGDRGSQDPESWTKVAGNYGPAIVKRWGVETQTYRVEHSDENTVFAPGAFRGLPKEVPLTYGIGGPVIGTAEVAEDNEGIHVTIQGLP